MICIKRLSFGTQPKIVLLGVSASTRRQDGRVPANALTEGETGISAPAHTFPASASIRNGLNGRLTLAPGDAGRGAERTAGLISFIGILKETRAALSDSIRLEERGVFP
jgi:hypothetical protein